MGWWGDALFFLLCGWAAFHVVCWCLPPDDDPPGGDA